MTRRRLFSTMAVLAFFGVAVVLLLSDRAPLVFPMLTSAIRSVGRRVEAITGIDVIDRDEIPFDTDLLGHAALWFCGMIVVGFALRKKIPTIVTAMVMIAIGIGFEFGQFYWTQSRQISVDDAIANSVGIVAATFVVIVVGGVIDFVAFLRRRLRRRSGWVGDDALGPRADTWSTLEPTAVHQVPAPGDPWIPPGYALPTYPPPSAPTWRYGSAAHGNEETTDSQWAPKSSAYQKNPPPMPNAPGKAPALDASWDSARAPMPRPLIEPTKEHPVR